MLRGIFLLTSVILVLNVQAQDPATYLKQNAVKIDDPEFLPVQLYNILSPYKLVMLGEIHGANEPAKFMIGLAKLFASKGDSVQVGLEIPSEDMTAYISAHTDSSVYLSRFFADPRSEDGRETDAMAGIIAKLNNNPKVKIFFYDINPGDCQYTYQRDSMMYSKIKKQYQLHPGWKMLTLSGNVHNITSADNDVGTMTMGVYLKQDKELNLGDQIFTIKHYFIRGSMVNTNGRGLELKTVDNGDNVMSQTLGWDKYFLVANPIRNYPYTAIYFTETVTAAKMLNKK